MEQWFDPAPDRDLPGTGAARRRHLPPRRRPATFVQTRRRTGDTSL